MLRGWDNPESPFENAPESPNGDLLSPSEAQQDNQSPELNSGEDVNILRGWTDTNDEEGEEDDDELNQFGLDPLTPITGDSSSVGAWSVAPGVVDRNSFSIPYEYDNEDTRSSLYAERTSTSPRAGRSTKTSLNMSKDELDQPSSPGTAVFDDVDLEALADTLPSPTSNRDNGRRCQGAWTKRFLYEMRTNPTFKFKLIGGGSVLIVATCLIAIAVTLSGGNKSNSLPIESINSVGAPVPVFTETQDQPTYSPTALHTNIPTNSPDKSPTGSPSYDPTYVPTLVPSTVVPTVNPISALTTASPSSLATTSTPTYLPSKTVTNSPTMNCADTDGEWMTYNDKSRDCAWLDNGHNGAESARKDMNCLDSELGEKCRYTCRMYNGCMDYLLVSISDFTEDNDISIGNACADKEGLFLSEGGILRNCTWINEDPLTAPMKKSLNCGTSEIEKTELGAMCPGSCAGYNDCEPTESDISIVKVQSAPIDEDAVYAEEDGEHINDGGEPETDQENPLVRSDNINDCFDEDGLWLNHMGKHRHCRWFFTDEFQVTEKLRLNCGITEIGHKCSEACGCGKLHAGLVDATKERKEGIDEEGVWTNHENKLRQCRWLDYDGIISAESKKLINCGKTEIGLKCKEACGSVNNASQLATSCEDKKGLFQTHEGGIPRMCNWMDRRDPVERRELNCGKTEIGEMCQCKCSEPIQFENVAEPPLSSEQREQNNFAAVSHNSFVDTLRESVNEQVRCEDEEGEWRNHENKFRQCRWLDFDGEIRAEAKKLINCGKTQIGLKCKETCGCGEAGSHTGSSCEDKKGLFQTHEGGSPRTCNWMDRKDPVERRELNCGKTEIGVMCQCKCSEPIQFQTFADADEGGDTGFIDNLPQGDDNDTCKDEEGDWLNHENKGRQCRWLNLDNSEAKKLLNCGKTEIGLKCRETCGCGEAMPQPTGPCEDKKGEWKTSDGDTRTCEWMDRNFPIERRQQNCGLTEIGVMCQCKCLDVLDMVQDTHELTGIRDYVQPTDFIPLFEPTTPAPDVPLLRPHQGTLDETGKVVTIIASEDATVSQIDEKENYGDSIRLFVDSTPDAEMQALIVFDLSYIEQLISLINRAELHIYARQGSPYGGVEFKKMLDTEFRQGAVNWNNMPGDGTGEPTIAFLDNVADDTWYKVDVTAAVKAAFMNGEERLGIRIVSSESHFSFASKDTNRLQPALVIDSRTKPPTSAPVPKPTPYPTASPVITLDCMDKKGFFVSHAGESKSCSWFDVGNGEQKKELNCKGNNSEASIFCQSQCSAYNGCDTLTCDDKSGSYLSHTGVKERCPWLLTGAGTLKLEQNCGTSEYPITELGKRCQATCAQYNECGGSSS